MPKPVRFVIRLVKGAQASLFGGGGGRSGPEWPPKGPGWEPIPTGKKGGYRKRKPGGGWERRYPPEHLGANKPAAPAPAKKPTRDLAAEDEAPAPRRRGKQDTGERIEGARKHAYEAVTTRNIGEIEAAGEGVARKAVTKKAILGDWDPQRQRDVGDTAGCAYWKEELLKLISAKPPHTNDKEARKNIRYNYVEGLEWLQKQLETIHTVAELNEFMDDWKDLARGKNVWGIESGSGRSASRAMAGGNRLDSMTADQVLEWLEMPPEAATRPEGQVGMRSGLRVGPYWIPYEVLGIRGLSNIRTTVWSSKDPSKSRYKLVMKHDAVTDTFYGSKVDAMGTRLRKALGFDRRYGSTSGAFWEKHRWEAQRLEEDGEKGWDKYMPQESASAEKPKRPKSTPFVPHRRPLQRKGGPRSRGPYTGEKLERTFGFRGTQYGKGVNEETARVHIENTHKALLDLADVLGLDRKMIAHRGILGIAYGARGRGKAKAHYEPMEQVINLTKKRGAGSLAHEWGHFLDHVLTETVRGPQDIDLVDAPMGDGGMVPFLSWGHGHEALHPEVATALRDVLTAMNKGDNTEEREALSAERRGIDEAISKHNARHRELTAGGRRKTDDERAAHNESYKRIGARRKRYNARRRALRAGNSRYKYASEMMGSYWSRPHEMFARAFESYVQDKLEDNGRVNTYLVDGTRKAYNLSRVKGGELITGLDVYPRGEERQRINAAFDKFFAAMREHGALEKAVQKRLDVEQQGQDQASGPKALPTHAALVDGQLQQLGHRLEMQRGQLEDAIKREVSPLQKAHLKKLLYQLNETAGALRFSPVTGGDPSDLDIGA